VQITKISRIQGKTRTRKRWLKAEQRGTAELQYDWNPAVAVGYAAQHHDFMNSLKPGFII
jgi:hypothetical protein